MIFTIKHKGKIHKAKNIIVKEGLELLRDGSRRVSGLVALPIQGTAVDFLDTLPSHPGWTFVSGSDYSGATSINFVNDPVANAIVSNTVTWVALADFTLDGVMSFWDGGFFPDSAGSAVHLFSAALLAMPIDVEEDDELEITYTISGAHNAIT